MKNINLTKFEKLKIFLNEYYFGYSLYYTILRMLGGPIILVIGLNLYYSRHNEFGSVYSGFMIAFGVYYMIKPLIFILTKKQWFESFNIDFQIDPDKVVIVSDKSKSELDHSIFDKILRRKTYFALRTKTKQAIYFPIKDLDTEEIEILDKLKVQ